MWAGSTSPRRPCAPSAVSDKLAAFSQACLDLPQDGTFECFTLDTLPDERGGCAEPWCHAMPEGQGVGNQGWERGEPHSIPL